MGVGLGAGPFPAGVLVTCTSEGVACEEGVLEATDSPTGVLIEDTSSGGGALGLVGVVVLVGTAGAGPFLEGVDEALLGGVVLAGLPLTGGGGAGPLRFSPETGATTCKTDRNHVR